MNRADGVEKAHLKGYEKLENVYTLHTQRRNEGLPKMQRAATQLINIQTFYSQRAVRLKIIVKYCHFCFEDLVFSKVCLDNFLV